MSSQNQDSERDLIEYTNETRVTWLIREINRLETAISQLTNQHNAASTVQNRQDNPAQRLAAYRKTRGIYLNELEDKRASTPMGAFRMV